jgi:hypothetical protein
MEARRGAVAASPTGTALETRFVAFTTGLALSVSRGGGYSRVSDVSYEPRRKTKERGVARGFDALAEPTSRLSRKKGVVSSYLADAD